MGRVGPLAAIAAKRLSAPITATGAFTTSTFEGRKFFTFTGAGTVKVNTAIAVDYIAIGGGGGGGSNGAGGGAAGVLTQGTNKFVAAGSYGITIGNGGTGAAAASYTAGLSGSASAFGTIATALGGAGGGGNNAAASAGGSNPGEFPGGTPAQYDGGGGGGAGGPGISGTTTGAGGRGITYNTGVIREIGGGGGGGNQTTTTPSAGTFGGGNGGINTLAGKDGGNGGLNTGGGGGGSCSGNPYYTQGKGGNGGSGIFIISYPLFTFTPTGTITWPSGTFLPKTASILTGPTSYVTSLAGVSCRMGGGYIGTPIAGSLVTPDINSTIWYAYAKDSTGYIRIARFGVAVNDRIVSVTAYDSKYYLDAGTAISASTVVGLYATATNASYSTTTVGIYGLVFTTLDSYISRMVNGVRYYTFLTSGSITTSEAVVMDYFAIGGGGAGATNGSGGGGAGGLRQGFTLLPAGLYNLTIGDGGQGISYAPTSGYATTLSGTSVNAFGGGAGGQDVSGTSGGCGGGTGYNRGNGNSGGVGLQGFNGGGVHAGGGGGLGAAGSNGGAGPGGLGITFNGEQFGGGGGGGSTNDSGGAASYGGGAGGNMTTAKGSNGTQNTGGGGGAGINRYGIAYEGGNGGSGVFICSFFTPTSIAGCNLWLDANDVNGTGTNAAAGTALVNWTDKSGSGLNATTTGGPVLTYFSSNGMPAVRMGTGQYALLNTGNTGTSLSAFAVATAESVVTFPAQLLSVYKGSDTNDYMSMTSMAVMYRESNVLQMKSYRTVPILSGFLKGLATPFLATTMVNSTNVTEYLDGALTGTASSGVVGAFGYDRIIVGAGYPTTSPGGSWTGAVSEVITYTTALSSYNRLRVETYLASKYSIAATPLAFAFTGTDQLVVVPPGKTTATVYLWGAGGGNGTSERGAGDNPYAGGAGAMVQGVITVTAGEILTVMVGEGGGQLRRTTYGGGGAASNIYGSGGGRSAIRRGGVDVVTAGAGGGGGNQRPDYYEGTSFGGSATFSGTANNGYATTGYGQAYAFGGSQTAGGARGADTIYGTAFPGGFNYGGAGVNGGSGGGSGYYGGGGSSWGYGDMSGAGGGGSSFTTNLTLIPGETVLGYNSSNKRLPPAAFSPWYESGVATRGGHGRVVIIF